MAATPKSVERKPIGWGGKRASDMLAESERLIEETGHYCGTEQLQLKESDPIRYEKWRREFNEFWALDQDSQPSI